MNIWTNPIFIDEIITRALIFLSKKEVECFCLSNKQSLKLYHQNELWRLKLSHLIEYYYPNRAKYNYKRMYEIVEDHTKDGIVSYTFNNILVVASHEGFDLLVRLSLERGADIFQHDVIYAAAGSGNIESVKLILDKGENINSWALLAEPCRHGHLDMVKFLIERGVNPNDGQAIIEAAEIGNLGIVTYLIEKGANLHVDAESALRRACYHGHCDIVKLLIEKGADLVLFKASVVYSATAGGHIDIVKLLIKSGLDIHIGIPRACDRGLIDAAGAGKLDMVKFLLTEGANIHVDNDEALKIACRERHLNIVTYILGECQNLPRGWFLHPDNDILLVACQRSNSYIVSLLLQYCAGISLDASRYLIGACNCPNILSVLLSYEITLSKEDVVAFFSLIEYYQNNIFLACLDKNKNSDDIFHYSIVYGNITIVKTLIEKGFDVNKGEPRPLSVAIQHEHSDIVQLLIDNGAETF